MSTREQKDDVTEPLGAKLALKSGKKRIAVRSGKRECWEEGGKDKEKGPGMLKGCPGACAAAPLSERRGRGERRRRRRRINGEVETKVPANERGPQGRGAWPAERRGQGLCLEFR